MLQATSLQAAYGVASFTHSLETIAILVESLTHRWTDAIAA